MIPRETDMQRGDSWLYVVAGSGRRKWNWIAPAVRGFLSFCSRPVTGDLSLSLKFSNSYPSHPQRV